MSSRRPGSARPSVPSRSSRESSRRHDDELSYECKAVYLTVYDDLTEEITSRSQLSKVLNQAGRNPTKRMLNKYWKEDTESLTFEDFCDICRKEPATSEDDIINAFKKIDLNGDGYITVDELYKVMTTRGDKMTRSEVKSIIDEVDENKDGKLDYREFSKMILSTQDEVKTLAKQRLDQKERRRREPMDESRRDSSSKLTQSLPVVPSARNKGSPRVSARSDITGQTTKRLESPKYTDRDYRGKKTIPVKDEDDDDDDDDIVMGSSVSLKTKSSSRSGPTPKPRRPRDSSGRRDDEEDDRLSPKNKDGVTKDAIASKKLRLPEPRNLKDWSMVHSKGCFFVEEDGSLMSHQYSLSLSSSSSVYISVEPYSLRSSGAMHSAREVGGAPIDTMLLIMREKPDLDGRRVVAVTDQRDLKGKYCVKCDLKKGRYVLIPFTTGCRLRKRKSDAKVETKLVRKKDDQFTLTKQFKEALTEIFEMCDLDGDGRLSREEFNWFNNRTSAEDLGDDEWEVVKENVELKDNGLTLKGFLDLNQLEAEDNQGDTDDLWANLVGMGYNKALEMDETCPFFLEVYSDRCDDAKLSVTSLDAPKKRIEGAICELAMDKGEGSKVKGMKDLYTHTYTTDFWAAVLVENKSYSRVSMVLDCSASKNVVSHHGNLEAKVELAPKSAQVGHFLMPCNERQSWSVRITEDILK